MGFCTSTFKFLLFLVNFIFFLVGIGMIALGAYTVTVMEDYFKFLETPSFDLKLSVYTFIVVGVLITMISFFGCCAAFTDNKCMMVTFATLMALILVAEIGVAISVIIYREKAYDIVQDTMKIGLNSYKEVGKESVTAGWDEIQNHFQCCGVNNSTDWTTAKAFNNTKNVPSSCCVIEASSCGVGKNKFPFTGLHPQGCFEQFEKFVEGNVLVVGGVGIVFIVVQLIVVVTGCCLAKKVDRKKQNTYFKNL